MSYRDLVYESREDRMKFDTSEQLFGKESPYGTIQGLNRRFKELNAQKEGKDLNYLNTGGELKIFSSVASNSLASPRTNIQEPLKGSMKPLNLEKLTRRVEESPEKNLIDGIISFKSERNAIRTKQRIAQDEMAGLLEIYEKKREYELRAQIEKDQLRDNLRDYEKLPLKPQDQEKKVLIERLVFERDNLKHKEDTFFRDLGRMNNEFEAIRTLQKADFAAYSGRFDSTKMSIYEARRNAEKTLEQRFDRILALKQQHEGLEQERKRILDDLKKIKESDSVRRNLSNVYAANSSLNDPRYKGPYLNDEEVEQVTPRKYPVKVNTSGTFLSPRTDMRPTARTNISQNLGGLRTGAETTRDITMSQLVTPRGQLLSPRVQLSTQTESSVQTDDVHDEARRLKGEYIHFGGNNPKVVDVLERIENNHAFFGSSRPGGMGGGFSSEGLLPNDYQNALSARDRENERLRAELAAMKLKTDGVNNLRGGQFSLADMQLRGGMLGYGASSKEFFAQNEVRNVDLAEEERMMVNMAAQDVDGLRMMSMLPIGTELYRFKLEQYKELSTTRAEVEKLVQEQRLMKLRRDFEVKRREDDKKWDNHRFVDDWRKQIINTRLRKELNQDRAERRYDPTEGFVIHWDYCLGVPKRYDYMQLVYGIYMNGEEVYSPSLINPHDCETDTSATNRCIFGESHHVTQIPANSNTLLIFELQNTSSSDNTKGRVTSYAWTQLDLFDSKRELKRGKFKCPLYVVPTVTSIDIDGIKYLEPIESGMIWFYLRISWPNNDYELGKQGSLYPENTHFEYIIPQIHLRAFRPPVERIVERIVEREEPPRELTPEPKEDSRPESIIEEPPEEDDNANKQPQMELPQVEKPEKKVKKKPKLNNASQIQNPNVSGMNSQVKKKNPRPGIYVIIHQVKDHVARSHFKVACALFEESQIILDERGRQCVFNTSIHNPLDLQNKEMRLATQPVPSGYNDISNKAQGMDIIYHEDHLFLRDIPLMLKTQKIRRDIYLNLQVLEKPEPVNVQTTDTTISYRAQEESANFGGMEFKLYGWYLIKLNTSEGRILTGKFCRQLFNPPLRKPPLDEEKVTKMDSEIEFTVQEYEFDDKDLDNLERRIRVVKRQLKKEEEERKKKQAEEEKDRDIAIDNAPYIPNTKPQYTDKTFEKGFGVDFYIDGARFLPDNVTVVKVVFTLVNQDYEILKQPEAGVPDLDSMTFSPMFSFRTEIRMDRIDPTALALIAIETVDKSSNESRIVGYSAINLFIDRYSKQQPSESTQQDIILFDGAYQLPIFCQEPYRTKPFNVEKMYALERLPTASLLVRIHHAPISADGLRVLSLSDVPKKKWAEVGVWRPRPNYGRGVYNTSLCPTRESERELFILRQVRPDMTVRETAEILLGVDGINKQMSDKELRGYLEKKIQRNSSTIMTDMMYFARYQAQAGFKFSLDGLHLVPKESIPYIGLYCMNPPGDLYLDEPDHSKIQMTSLLNWEGPAKSPQWLDGYITFKDIPHQNNLHMLIDIRSVSFAKTTPEFSKIGWTICPIFSPDGFVLSGIYQIPLFKGEFPKGLRQELQENDPWPYLMELMKNKKNPFKLSFLGDTTVICRLVDSQREGHFSQAWDPNRIDYRYIPQNKLREVGYNVTWEAKLQTATKLQSIVPNKRNPYDYNHNITRAFVEELQLPYQN